MPDPDAWDLRRYGGTPLYAETYGVHAAYVTQGYELHATGFIADPVIRPVDHRSGGAGYADCLSLLKKGFDLPAFAMM